MTYSADFRKKVFELKEKEGLTFQETSKRFGVHISALFRWVKQPEPCKHKNRPATKVDMDKLVKDVELYPDDYQWERAKRLKVTQSSIHYALKRLGITVKKNAKAPKS